MSEIHRYFDPNPNRRITWTNWGVKNHVKTLTEQEALRVQADVMHALGTRFVETQLFIEEGVTKRAYTIYKRPKRTNNPNSAK